MNKIEKVISGLKLIEKHRPQEASSYHIRCEHDELIAGSLNWGVPIEQMEELGWSAIKDYDGFRILC